MIPDREAILTSPLTTPGPRVWPENESPEHHIRNALALIVALNGLGEPPSREDIRAIQERLERAVELWDAEDAELEQAVIRQAEDS